MRYALILLLLVGCVDPPVVMDQCPVCTGQGNRDCSFCDNGYRHHRICDRKGCADCNWKGIVVCEVCEGKGVDRCDYCNGAGVLR